MTINSYFDTGVTEKIQLGTIWNQLVPLGPYAWHTNNVTNGTLTLLFQ